ncbi:MAG: alpha/beta hydrolase [Alphaproteobacteria bacterium]|nr:alpha/beta hydrolase [Alphaproteobacteria bacterium]OJV45445.1 MAG: alpha/beta hydrolase [Alphaproteobacteria bacterium 43-37]
MPEVIFPGPEGRIEARYHHSKVPNAPIAIILHPHPADGGTMNNKIVFNLFKTFVDQGFNTLRFNFRGVGRSEGRFDHGEGELSDAAAALDWLQAQNPNSNSCWVAGFSFGAWIGMQLLMRRPEIDGFISISPPANLYDFNFLAPCPVSGMILQGENDTIVTHDSVLKLVDKLNSQKGIAIDYRVVQKAGHFFDQQLEELSANVLEYLTKAIAPLHRVANL